jgi:Neuraminidase (sialidase)
MNYLCGESDVFIGKRSRLKRYLVCSMEGYFPVVTKTGPNSAAAIFRTGAPHVGINATLAVSTSADGGKCWSDPIEIVPRWEDARNPALGVNSKGELIAAFWKAKLHNYENGNDGNIYNSNSDFNKEGKEKIAALFTSKSSDNGKTWEEAKPYMSKLLTLASPYGRIIKGPDGTLFMSVYGTPRSPEEGVRDMVILMRSTDDGSTWGNETIVAKGYNETSFEFLKDGTMIAAARSEKGGHIDILFSKDMGITWSEPVNVTRDGEHPADLTLLQSGRLLLTFGRRIRPMGCGALISDDNGMTWNREAEVLLAGDGGESFDLGYPSTVQFDDGNIITVLYYAAGSEMSSIWKRNWGYVSCQAIHYNESDIIP